MDKKIWLVKSAGKIQGPFNRKSIGEMLKARRISVIDEVVAPFGRWSVLGESRDFVDVIESFKNSLDQEHEDTVTENITQVTMTETDITEELPSHLQNGNVDENTQPIIMAPEFTEDAAPKKRKIKSYGLGEGRQEVNTKSGLSKVWFYSGALVLVSLILFKFVMYSKKEAGAGGGGLSSLEKGIYHYEVGEFREALGILSQEPLSGKNTNVGIWLALLYLDQGEVNNADRILESLKKLGLKSVDMSDIHMIKGMIEAQLDNYKEAAHFFKLARSHRASRHNQGMVQYYQKNFIEALGFLNSSLQKSPFSRLMKQLVRIESFAGEKVSASELRGQLEGMRKDREASFPYRFESLFLEAYGYYLLGDWKKVEATLAQFVGTNYFRSEDHVPNLFELGSGQVWQRLGELCEDFYVGVQPFLGERPHLSPLSEAARGLCLLKARSPAASQAFEKAVVQMSRTDRNERTEVWQLVNTSRIAYFIESGRSDEAINLLKSRNESERGSLARIYEGRICRERNDYNCVLQNGSTLVEEDSNSIEGLGYMAWSHWRGNERAKAKGLIDRGIALSPNYIPFKKLQLEMY